MMDVILLVAMTLDGKIARHSMEKIDWSGKEDKQYFVQVTREAGVMIMGSNTYDTIGRALPGRMNIVMTTRPSRVSREDNLIFTNKQPAQILSDLGGQGYQKVVLVGGSIIYSLFARENLITHIHVTIVPSLFGKGLSIFNEPMDTQLELEDTMRIGTDHFLLKYRVKNPNLILKEVNQ